MSKVRVCKDCEEVNKRPASYPGPRCATHDRERRRALKATNHDRSVSKIYGLARGEYARLYEEQEGRCFICRLATGKSKRLAVDHDHVTGRVRGLLCGPCNQYLGYIRSSPDAYRRGIEYLERAAVLV